MHCFISKLTDGICPVKHDLWQCLSCSEFLDKLNKFSFISAELIPASRFKDHPTTDKCQPGRAGCLKKVIHIHGMNICWKIFWNRIFTLGVKSIEAKKLSEVGSNLIHFYFKTKSSLLSGPTAWFDYFNTEAVKKVSCLGSKATVDQGKITSYRGLTVSTTKQPTISEVVICPHCCFRN